MTRSDTDWRRAWAAFSAAGDSGPALREQLAEKNRTLRQFRPVTKAFPAALRRVIRARHGHLAAFEKAIGGLGAYEARFEQSQYMPLVIEVLPVSPANCPAVSVAHYFKQNGDSMRDPEIVFACVSPEAWLPYEITQDPVGMYSCAFRDANLFHPRVSASMMELVNIWGRNLGHQEWGKARCVRFNGHKTIIPLPQNTEHVPQTEAGRAAATFIDNL